MAFAQFAFKVKYVEYFKSILYLIYEKLLYVYVSNSFLYNL